MSCEAMRGPISCSGEMAPTFWKEDRAPTAYRATGAVALKGVPIDGLTLYFTGERLSGIAAGFQESRFDEVAERLAQDYGPGTIETWEADPGANSTRAVLVWRQGSRLLRLERSSKTGRSSVIVAERNFISELIEP